MDKTKQREEFEAMILRKAKARNYKFMDTLLLKYDDGSYRTSWVDSAFMGWQEALASIEIERPGTTCVGWVKEAIHEHDDKWIETIKAAGLRVKS